MVPFHGQNFVHFRGGGSTFLDGGVLEEFGAIRMYSHFPGGWDLEGSRAWISSSEFIHQGVNLEV